MGRSCGTSWGRCVSIPALLPSEPELGPLASGARDGGWGPSGPSTWGASSLHPASHWTCVFSSLVEAGLSHHPEPIPRPTGEQGKGKAGWLGELKAGQAWLPEPLLGPVLLGAA